MAHKILIAAEIEDAEFRRTLADRLTAEGHVVVNTAEEAELLIAPDGDEDIIVRAITDQRLAPPTRSRESYGRRRALGSPLLLAALAATCDIGWAGMPGVGRGDFAADVRNDVARPKTANDLARMEAAEHKRRRRHAKKEQQKNLTRKIT